MRTFNIVLEIPGLDAPFLQSELSKLEAIGITFDEILSDLLAGAILGDTRTIDEIVHYNGLSDIIQAIYECNGSNHYRNAPNNTCTITNDYGITEYYLNSISYSDACNAADFIVSQIACAVYQALLSLPLVGIHTEITEVAVVQRHHCVLILHVCVGIKKDLQQQGGLGETRHVPVLPITEPSVYHPPSNERPPSFNVDFDDMITIT